MTNLLSQFIKFYFTSSMLSMFRTLIHPSSGAANFLFYHHIGCVFLFRCVLEFRCGWFGVVSVWKAEAVLQPATRIPHQPCHTETPTHIEARTHNQCGDKIKSRKLMMMDILMPEVC